MMMAVTGSSILFLELDRCGSLTLLGVRLRARIQVPVAAPQHFCTSDM
jgi:hypothetical protein